MKTFTIQDIRSWGPCYDPLKYLPEDWSGTAKEILMYDTIPHEDKLWAVLRKQVTTEKVMRLFAVWAYRDTLNWVTNPDPRSVEAANVAERFALGQATAEELSAAAWSAWSARSAWAAGAAAWSAGAWSARSAWAAAWSARSAAAWSARSAAELSARSAAELSARSAAQKRQCIKLLEMIETDQ